MGGEGVYGQSTRTRMMTRPMGYRGIYRRASFRKSVKLRIRIRLNSSFIMMNDERTRGWCYPHQRNRLVRAFLHPRRHIILHISRQVMISGSSLSLFPAGSGRYIHEEQRYHPHHSPHTHLPRPANQVILPLPTLAHISQMKKGGGKEGGVPMELDIVHGRIFRFEQTAERFEDRH